MTLAALINFLQVRKSVLIFSKNQYDDIGEYDGDYEIRADKCKIINVTYHVNNLIYSFDGVLGFAHGTGSYLSLSTDQFCVSLRGCRGADANDLEIPFLGCYRSSMMVEYGSHEYDEYYSSLIVINCVVFEMLGIL